MRHLTPFLLCLAVAIPALAQSARWTEEQAAEWYANQPWLVGCNFTPSTAINQLERWQADTFDPKTIDRELGLAESIGMNVVRVYLHDLVWKADAEGFTKRLDEFLTIADKHKIRVIFVLFDSVWDPNPKLGKQRAPKPGVHNSGWMQNPGADALADPSQYPRLEAYVKGLVGAFKDDPRILAWDVWNEPDNTNDNSYGDKEPKNKKEIVSMLLPKVFAWARAANQTQPLTCGIWIGDWPTHGDLRPMERMQVECSDVVSFHNYGTPEDFARRVEWLKRYHRPLLCTEYMARGNGSTFQGIMPIGKQHKIALLNWGLVEGKTQTHLPWDSWQNPYTDREPTVWFHEVFKNDGTPYRQEEVDVIRKMTGMK